MPIKTCKHNNKIKKKLSNVFCGKGVWVDNQGQEWNYCQGHICVFCKSNIHTNDSRIPFGSKARKAISHDSKANPFYFCNNKKECSAKLKTIESLNTEAVKKLKKAKDNLINEKLANDPQIEAEWRIEISPFIDNLFDEEENIIKQNFQPTPIFTVDNLKQIGDWIENSDLSDGKNELRLCYSSAGGKIDNVILEKEIFFTNLGRKIKLNKIKKTYIQKLENLDGWNLLNDKSQNYYQKQINKLEPFSFDAVIESAKSEIKRIKDDRERERERDKKDRENPNIPPQQPKNPKQPDPNSPSPKLPDSPSDKKDPSDNSHQELEEIKQRIKSTHKLTEEEYNAIVASLNDKEILEHVSFLLGKVKEIQAEKDINTDSSEEYLLSYREATNSAKKKAYEAVNNYQQQVEKIITDLQNKKQVIKASLQELVSAESEEKLNQIYEKIKSEKEVYKDNNQKIIDNHYQRIHTAIKLEIKPEISETEKQLASKLRVIINAETEKNVLQKLAQELSEFKSAKEGEKKLIYKNYNQTIDLMLGEIKSELNRREHSQKEQEKKPPRKQKNVSEKQKGSISVPVIIGGAGLFLVAGLLLVIAWHRKRKLKLLKSKKIKK